MRQRRGGLVGGAHDGIEVVLDGLLGVPLGGVGRSRGLGIGRRSALLTVILLGIGRRSGSGLLAVVLLGLGLGRRSGSGLLAVILLGLGLGRRSRSGLLAVILLGIRLGLGLGFGLDAGGIQPLDGLADHDVQLLVSGAAVGSLDDQARDFVAVFLADFLANAEIALRGADLHLALAQPVGDQLVDGLTLRFGGHFAHDRSIDDQAVVGVAGDDHIGRSGQNGRSGIDQLGAVSSDVDQGLHFLFHDFHHYPFFLGALSIR